MAFEYAKLAQLDVMAPGNRTLVLDAVLCDALYKGLIKKGELYPTHIPKVMGPVQCWSSATAGSTLHVAKFLLVAASGSAG